MQRDQIYQCEHDVVERFCFDERVVPVFQDMIKRSVPGYGLILSFIGVLAEEYLQLGTQAYDLGCSLGACTLAMSAIAIAQRCQIHAIDNSSAMVTQAQSNCAKLQPEADIKFYCQDVSEVLIQDASMVVLNFTLQFIKPQQRNAIIAKIARGVLPGGILVLSEKIHLENKGDNQLLQRLHIGFKRANNYTDLEIAQKRLALEGMMILDTVATHRMRLLNNGFKRVELVFQALNFVTLVAFK